MGAMFDKEQNEQEFDHLLCEKHQCVMNVTRLLTKQFQYIHKSYYLIQLI